MSSRIMEFTNSSCLSRGDQRVLLHTRLGELSSANRWTEQTSYSICDQNRVQPKAANSFNLNRASMNLHGHHGNNGPPTASFSCTTLFPVLPCHRLAILSTQMVLAIPTL